jgi:hypothetical protein
MPVKIIATKAPIRLQVDIAIETINPESDGIPFS